MKKTSLFLIVLLFLSAPAWTQTASVNKTSSLKKTTEVKFKNDSINLGVIPETKVASCDFKFSNTGSASLVIANAKGSCHCVQATFPKTTKPGDSGIVHVTFDPKGVKGLFIRTVAVQSNAKEPVVVLTLLGEVK